METRWRIRLFGGLQAEQNNRILTRFRTQKAGALLAYLAFYLDRKHPREVLLELLSPGFDVDAARNRLRVELNSLRKQLEPPGVPQGAVLQTNRNSVGLNPAAVTTDVIEFEAALRAALRADDSAEQARCWMAAVELYRGELLPGFFEEWINAERQRLADAHLNALRKLTRLLGQAKEFDRAIDYARRAVNADPLHEASHRTLMRLYVAVGRPAAALEQFEELTRVLQEELGVAPSAATCGLVSEISEQLAVNRQQMVLVGGGQSVVKTTKQPSGRMGARKKGGNSQTAVRQEPHAPRSSILQFPVASHQPSVVGSLPLQFTNFFGREEEIAQLCGMLSAANRPSPRLVTLTGWGAAARHALLLKSASGCAMSLGAASGSRR